MRHVKWVVLLAVVAAFVALPCFASVQFGASAKPLITSSPIVVSGDGWVRVAFTTGADVTTAQCLTYTNSAHRRAPFLYIASGKVYVTTGCASGYTTRIIYYGNTTIQTNTTYELVWRANFGYGGCAPGATSGPPVIHINRVKETLTPDAGTLNNVTTSTGQCSFGGFYHTDANDPVAPATAGYVELYPFLGTMHDIEMASGTLTDDEAETISNSGIAGIGAQFATEDYWRANLDLGIGEALVTNQTIYPTADTANGNWVPSTGGNEYAVIDDISTDTDYIYANNVAEDSSTYALGNITLSGYALLCDAIARISTGVIPPTLTQIKITVDGQELISTHTSGTTKVNYSLPVFGDKSQSDLDNLTYTLWHNTVAPSRQINCYSTYVIIYQHSRRLVFVSKEGAEIPLASHGGITGAPCELSRPFG